MTPETFQQLKNHVHLNCSVFPNSPHSNQSHRLVAAFVIHATEDKTQFSSFSRKTRRVSFANKHLLMPV